MPSPLLSERLQDINQRLRRLIDDLSADAAFSTPRAASPQQIDALLGELRNTGAWLKALPPRREADLEVQLGTYRQLIVRLRDLLPGIYATLLDERSRIERERSRVASAAEWARRSRETL